MKLTKGVILKAKGGWDAEVVWVVPRRELGGMKVAEGFYAVHKPRADGESFPVPHTPDGKAIDAQHSPYRLPSYNGHPADLNMGNYEL